MIYRRADKQETKKGKEGGGRRVKMKKEEVSEFDGNIILRA